MHNRINHTCSIPVIQFSSPKQFLDYIGNDEISQEDNWNAYTRIFRISDNRALKLYIKNQEQAQINIETIYYMYRCESLKNIPNLVMPRELVQYKDTIIGYTMNYIEGQELQNALNDPRFSHKQKLHWFEQIAQVICSLPNNIHIADLHEKNIIISTEGNVFFIDIDGFAVDEIIQYSHQSFFDTNIYIPNKYFNKNKQIKLDYNLDVWCWFRLLFRYLMNGVDWLSISQECRNDYLIFLKKQGVNKIFIHSAKRLLKKKDNYLFPDIIADFPNEYYDTSYYRFLKNTSWGKKNEVAEKWLQGFCVDSINL